MALGAPAISGGLQAKSGQQADDTARGHAAARGLLLEAHRTKRLEELAIAGGDLVICMEPPQLMTVRKMCPTFTGQLTLLGLWSQPRRPWIFDPFGLPDECWCNCLDLIDEGVRRIVNFYRREHPGLTSLPIAAARVIAGAERGSQSLSDARPNCPP